MSGGSCLNWAACDTAVATRVQYRRAETLGGPAPLPIARARRQGGAAGPRGKNPQQLDVLNTRLA
eukprot:8449665-Pyramimonas_sp.AAC.1